MKPYQDKGWMYQHYVKRRMNLTDIADVLKRNYNIEITPQALYNWAKRHDLLKYRGKGRSLGKRSQKVQPKSPRQKQVQQYQRAARDKKRKMRGR